MNSMYPNARPSAIAPSDENAGAATEPGRLIFAKDITLADVLAEHRRCLDAPDAYRHKPESAWTPADRRAARAAAASHGRADDFGLAEWRQVYPIGGCIDGLWYAPTGHTAILHMVPRHKPNMAPAVRFLAGGRPDLHRISVYSGDAHCAEYHRTCAGDEDGFNIAGAGWWAARRPAERSSFQMSEARD